MKWEQLFLEVIPTIHFNKFLRSFTNIILYTSYATQVYLTLIFITKYIVIFKVWMDNWRMVLASLEQVVQEEKGGTNRMI